MDSRSGDEFGFPNVYEWISRLPLPSLWEQNSQSLKLFKDLYFGGLARFVVERAEDGCVSSFIDCPWKPHKVILKADIKWYHEESDMRVITFPLISCFMSCIARALNHPDDVSLMRDISQFRVHFPSNTGLISYNNFALLVFVHLIIRAATEIKEYLNGIDLSRVRVEPLHPSTTQSFDYPLLFNSALALMIVLECPIILQDRKIGSLISMPRLSELASAIGPMKLEETSVRPFGSIYTYNLYLLFNPDKPIKFEDEPFTWSCAWNTSDLCLLKVYCPLLSMKTQKYDEYRLPHTASKLQNALIYQHVESVIQLRYDAKFNKDCIKLHLGVDNIRCDVVPYENVPLDVNRDLMSSERYFPSRISLCIVPSDQETYDHLLISLDQSSSNPSCQIATGNAMGFTFRPPKEFGINGSTTSTSTVDIYNWEFQLYAQDVKGTFDWTLYDGLNEIMVSSSNPPRSSLLSAKRWYRNRYCKPNSPFTKLGGVVFAKDKYGQGITWTLNKNMKGKTLKWHIRGNIEVTYWPNKYNTSFCETRYHQFCQMVEIPLIVQRKLLRAKWWRFH